MRGLPSTGYYVEVDVAGDADDVRSLRKELNPKGVSVSVIALDGPGGGNPLVRLRSSSRTRLIDWLSANEYDLAAHDVVNAANPNSISRN